MECVEVFLYVYRETGTWVLTDSKAGKGKYLGYSIACIVVWTWDLFSNYTFY
jgi:hypothetical protein